MASGRVMELISRVHLRWKRRIASDLHPFGINPKQIYVLRKLARGDALTPSRVAELVFADRPTATSMLDTLERAGWVTRRADPANGKQVLVEITRRGRGKLASVPERLWRTGKTAVDPEGALSAAERVELSRLLEKMDAWIERAARPEES